jgi:hypothetical protein
MKHIKAYEDLENIKELKEDLKRLLLHIKYVLKDKYVATINFDDYQYSIWFSNSSKPEERVIDIQGEFSSSLTFLSITLRIGSVYDDFPKFLQEYFKTISGLELHSKNPIFFNITYKITDNIDNIINQISKEDMEIKLNSNKYNI